MARYQEFFDIAPVVVFSNTFEDNTFKIGFGSNNPKFCGNGLYVLDAINRFKLRVKILMDGNGHHSFVGHIAVVIGDGHMTVERHNLITYFLLQSQARSNGNEHDNNANGNGGNANFYNWCRNTTFIRLAIDNAFGNKKLVIQIYMRLSVFKNTVLLCVLIGISCGSKTKNDSVTKEAMLRQAQHDTNVVVGANRTELYLPLLKGKQVGVVANQTSVIFRAKNKYVHLVDSLLALNINVKKVFAPEHGFRGTADAGEEVKSSIDKTTGLPIVSLYGDNRKPKPEQLADLDVVVFDIQDVGVRFYTYLSTLHYVMEACAEAQIPVIVLDRPNPNGYYIDGPTLEPQNKSFIGMHPVPSVYGMSIGEYGKMINGEHWLQNGVKCDITIIPLKNYTHQTPYSLPIRPSPNLPNDQSIMLYPSLGLFEGTNINAGRGTEFQFQRYGAPFLNKEVFKFTYTPKPNFGAKHPKHENQLCFGEDLKGEARLGKLTLKWLIKAYNNATDKSLVFNTANFTRHAGTDKLQKQIEAGMTEDEIKATWQEDLEHFKTIRKKYLIYK